jgi:hypothetical protein
VIPVFNTVAVLWIGIVLMPIRIRISMTDADSDPDPFCRILTQDLYYCQMYHNFQYFGQHIEISLKKVWFLLFNFFICLELIWYRSGSAGSGSSKIMQNRPDLDPESQNCSIMDGMIVHCHEGHAQKFKYRWSPNLTLCWCRARGSSLCTTTWSISSLGKGRPQPPLATRRRKRPSKKQNMENHQEMSKRK